jgi:Tol biopolymer transport system component
LAVADQESGDVVVRNLLTGEVRHVTHNPHRWEPGGALIPRFSRDGKRIAFEWEPSKHNRSEIRIVDLNGAHLHTIYDHSMIEREETDPMDWSPDGKQLAALRFQRDATTQILLMPADSGVVRVLKSLDWRAPNMVFSPDGRYLAYDHPPHDDSNNANIYVIDLATNREDRVVDAPSDNRILAWTREGGILFVSDRSGTPGAWQLPIANGKAAGPPVLLKPEFWRVGAVGLAEAKGAYFYGVETGGTHVYVAATDPTTGKVSGAPTQVTRDPVTTDMNVLDWSPDGRSIAYSAMNSAGNTREVVIRSLETGDARELPLLGRQGYFSDEYWLPDGSGLVMLSHSVFYRLDVQSGKLAELASAPVQMYRFAGLRSGGREALYVMHRPRGEAQPENGDGSVIFSQDLNDGTVSVLTDFGETLHGFVCCNMTSPDGSTIAVAKAAFRSTPPAGQIILLPVRGGEPKVIADHLAFSGGGGGGGPYLAWSQDGRWIYFTTLTEHPPKSRIMRVSSSGGAAEAVGIEMDGLGKIRTTTDGRIAFAAGTAREELWVMERFLPEPKRASRNPQ